MKTKLSIIVLAAICFGCNKENSNTATNGNPSGTIWADSISAQSPVIIQEGWSEADWKKENKYNTEKIFNTIKDAVLAGKLQAYDVYENKLIPIDDFKKIISHTDTVEQEDIDKPDGPLRKMIIKNEIKAEDIARIDTKEKWFFDENTYTLKKVVESITFLTNSYTEKGEIRGVAAVFMVKLNH